MAKPNYKYRYWVEKTGDFSGKYRLQIFEPGDRTQYLYVLNLHFDTSEEMFGFLKDYFPSIQHVDCDSVRKVTDINKTTHREFA